MPVYNQNGASFRVFQDSRQGGRKYMEDVLCMRNYKSEDGQNDFVYFAVFDGHGGPEAAKFARDHLLEELKSLKGFWTTDKEEIKRSMKEAFISTHKLMWKNVGNWPKTVTGLPSTAGTTASVVLIKAGAMFIAHVGDSSVVLGEQNYWKNLQANCVTVDHKPESPIELKRIEASGGQVMSKSGVQRVVWHRPKPAHKGPIRRSTHIDDIPFLAVARALGDLWSYNSERDTFVVSPEPDIAVYDFNPSKHKCVIIASDGLWNMVKPEDSIGYVEELIAEDDEFTLAHNPARKLVQLALNKWAFRNMRADNTTVIVVMIDSLMSEEEFSKCSSRSSSTSTVQLSENESDLVRVQDHDENNRAKSESSFRNLTPSVKPSPQHIGFFRSHPKHMSFNGHSVTPIRSSAHIRPKTSGSAPIRSESERLHHRVHKNLSMKRYIHSHWGNRPRSGENIVIPTKYKTTDEKAKLLHNITKTSVPAHPKGFKTITPTKYRQAEVPPRNPLLKRTALWIDEDSHQTTLHDLPVEKPAAVIPSRRHSTIGVVSTVSNTPIYKSDDELPGVISKASPPQNELPELNKVIVPTKYKYDATSMYDSKQSTSSSHTSIKKRSLSESESFPIEKISPLQVVSAVTASKRKASMSLDCNSITSKKLRKNPSPTTEGISGNHFAFVGNNDRDSPKMATSARSPLKINTAAQDSPSAANASPLWPGCSSKDISLDVHSTEDLCIFPVTGTETCRIVLRENIPEPVKPKSINYSRLSKKSFGAQNGSIRNKILSKSQGSKLNVRNLRIRSKRPIKLRNIKHRTRFQVKATITRKS